MGKIERSIGIGAPGRKLFRTTEPAQLDSGADDSLVPPDIARAAGLRFTGWDVNWYGGETPVLGRTARAVIAVDGCKGETDVFVPVGVLPRRLDPDRPLRGQLVGEPPRLFILGHPFMQAAPVRLDFSNESLSRSAAVRRRRRDRSGLVGRKHKMTPLITRRPLR